MTRCSQASRRRVCDGSLDSRWGWGQGENPQSCVIGVLGLGIFKSLFLRL